MSDILLIHREHDAVEFTLNRPDSRNALSRALIARLSNELQTADADPAVRSVVLTGAGPAFCAGLDLREVAATSADQAEHDASSLVTLFETVDNLSKPVIAAVNGPAVAGGAGLVSVCDIVLCARSGVIGYPEINRGLVAAIVMNYLRRMVGERQAKWLLLTGENLPAERALEMRLCNEVVDDSALMERARYYTAMFKSYPAQALANTKRLWNQTRGLQHAAAIAEARRLNASMRLTGESRQGIGDFLKR